MICTFYSYKGGVGRSMAMANVADILSRRGAKVLMVDFDLEAPGLESFFHVNHDGVRRHLGLLDLLLTYKQSMSVARSDADTFRRLEDFICPVYERLPGGGRLDIMAAGQRQDPDQLARYALNLRTFDWQSFYFDWEGGVFFEWLRKQLVPGRYDLVLVDSRTGVTEMGGICGYQLADVIVMFCAANHQNLQGTRNMVRDFRSPSVESLRQGRALDLVIVPARIEQRDPALLEDFFARFEQEFGSFVPGALRQAALDFRALTIPYEPKFAFEERIVSGPSPAAERQRIGDAFGLLANAVALLGKLPNAGVAPSAPAARETLTAPAPSAAQGPIQYDPTKRFADYDVFVDTSRTDQESADAIVRGLTAHSLRVFHDTRDLSPGANWQTVVEDAVFHSHVLLYCVGKSGLSEWRRRMLDAALRARERGQDLTIVPVLLPGSTFSMLEGTALAQLSAFDMRGGVAEPAIERLCQDVRRASSRTVRIESESRDPFVGPRPFLESDADLFFGRDQAVASLLALTVEQLTLERRVTTIVGPSGCGKTSLVNAGLLPAVRRSATPGTSWKIVCVRPDPPPLGTLIDSLQETREKGSSRGATLMQAITAAARKAAPGRLLVFVDQLEEIFTRSSRPAREEFARSIAEAALQLPDNAHLVMALRSSFIGSVTAELPELWNLCGASVFQVATLNQDELRKVIEGPVERVGAALEPGLVDRIVAEMRGEPTALPLLQMLLFRLWQERRGGWVTNEAFARVNGLGGVVTAAAEELYGRLGPEEQGAVRWIMLRLVRPGTNGEDTRLRLPLDALMPADATRKPEVAALYKTAAKALIGACLLISKDEHGRRVLEPAHESLVRGWPRLREWLDAERAFLVWREQLSAKIAEWQRAQQAADLLLRGSALSDAERWGDARGSDLTEEEHAFIERSAAGWLAELERRDRVRKRGFVLLSAAAVVFLALAVFALWQMRDAQAQYQLAESRLKIAEDTVAQLQATQKTLKELADAQATAATTSEEKRQQAERALRQLQASLATLQTRVDDSKDPEAAKRRMLQQYTPRQ